MDLGLQDSTHRDLSRRERQIMDILYESGASSAAEIQRRLPSPPSYSAVRAMLSVLESKGHVEHEQDGPRYVYRPTVPVERAARSAFKRLLRTFFDDSLEDAVATLLDISPSKLTNDELDRLAKVIDDARRDGR